MSKQCRTVYEKKYLAAVGIWEEWLNAAKAETDEKGVEECAAIINELKVKNARLVQALDAFDTHGLGVTFAHESNESWAMVILDATENTATAENSSFRYQLYDRRGFIGHGCYPSPYAAVSEAFDMGFTNLCASPLDGLVAEEEWQQGMAATEAAQQSWRTAVGGN